MAVFNASDPLLLGHVVTGGWPSHPDNSSSSLANFQMADDLTVAPFDLRLAAWTSKARINLPTR